MVQAWASVGAESGAARLLLSSYLVMLIQKVDKRDGDPLGRQRGKRRDEGTVKRL